jgi:hypothetical protein
MRRTLITVAVASLVSWGALWLSPRFGGGAARREAVTAEGQADEAQQPSVATTKAAAPAAPPAAKPQPVQATQAGADNLTEDGRPLNEKALVLHRAFRAEQRDPAWADVIEKKLQDYTATFQLGDHEVESIQCASSICRLQFAFRGDDYEQRVYMLSRAMGRMYAKNYALEPLGEVGDLERIVVWTSREAIDQQRASLEK